MSRWSGALLVACVCLACAECDLSVVSDPTRCEGEGEGDCPPGYQCRDGKCQLEITVDAAAVHDAHGVEGAATDRSGTDAIVRDLSGDEGPAVDASNGHDRAIADVSVDAQHADSGAPDTLAGSDAADTPVDSGAPDTPVDSGAPDTPVDSGPRGVGEVCLADAECQSGFCHPVGRTCQLPTCDDGYQNQGESGVDCGGAGCPACPTCWGNAANFNFADENLDFSAAVDLSGCSPTIDTSVAPDLMLDGWCGPRPAPVVQPQVGGPSIAVVPMSSLAIGAGQTLRLVGDKPVVLAVRGDAWIYGVIDVGAKARAPGAGGDLSTDGTIATAGGAAGTGDCNVFAAGTGQGMNREPGSWSLGGGGGGFRTNGGFGGGERPIFRCYSNPGYSLVADGYECKPLCPDMDCDNSFVNSVNRYQANNSAHYAVAPIYGLAALDQSLTPLRGGCAGGRGETRDSSTAYYGGSGGGAVQLSVAGTLTIGAGGTVSAGGGGGAVVGDHGSGSGGGSGGAILLEATVVDVSAAAGIRAHGGSGGGRDCGDATAESGHVSDDDYATHTMPARCVAEGRGGLSYWAVGNPACNGAGAAIGSALACTRPVADWPTSTNAYPQGGTFSDNNGGGGGGGSGGVIVVRRLAMSGSCP